MMKTFSQEIEPENNTTSVKKPPSSHLTARLKELSDVDHPHESPELVIRPVLDRDEMDEVYKLTHDAYLERGYCEPQADGRLIHAPHLDHIAETTVLVAVLNGSVVGTASTTFDGPAGLHVDKDFKETCDQVRAEGRKLASSWRIATRNCFRQEKQVVMRLIDESVALWISKIDTCLCTFNPRHERIYKRILGMEAIDRHEGSVDGLNNAPAVLMRWDLERCPTRFFGKKSIKTGALDQQTLSK